jgi:hypothetical protein
MVCQISNEHAKFGRWIRSTVLAMLSDDAGRPEFSSNWYQRSDTCCRIDHSPALMVMSRVMGLTKMGSGPHFQTGPTVGFYNRPPARQHLCLNCRALDQRKRWSVKGVPAQCEDQSELTLGQVRVRPAPSEREVRRKSESPREPTEMTGSPVLFVPTKSYQAFLTVLMIAAATL